MKKGGKLKLALFRSCPAEAAGTGRESVFRAGDQRALQSAAAAFRDGQEGLVKACRKHHPPGHGLYEALDGEYLRKLGRILAIRAFFL
jgi:hypothetical protein